MPEDYRAFISLFSDNTEGKIPFDLSGLVPVRMDLSTLCTLTPTTVLMDIHVATV